MPRLAFFAVGRAALGASPVAAVFARAFFASLGAFAGSRVAHENAFRSQLASSFGSLIIASGSITLSLRARPSRAMSPPNIGTVSIRGSFGKAAGKIGRCSGGTLIHAMRKTYHATDR